MGWCFVWVWRVVWVGGFGELWVCLVLCVDRIIWVCGVAVPLGWFLVYSYRVGVVVLVACVFLLMLVGGVF